MSCGDSSRFQAQATEQMQPNSVWRTVFRICSSGHGELRLRGRIAGDEDTAQARRSAYRRQEEEPEENDRRSGGEVE